MTSAPVLRLLRLRHDIPAGLRGGPAGLVTLAIAVGAGSGVAAIAFRYLILQVTRIATGSDDYSATGGAGNPHLPALGPWFVLIVPVAGGLIYGPIVHFFAREARGHGVPEVMLAVAERGGRIRPQVSVVKAVASALCIGTGGSVGREGPIVQISSALGSSAGQLLRVPEARMRILVACGAAGGISATFNAPIAGVLFALELIILDFAAESFGVVVLSSVTAAVVGQAAFGSQPFLSLPAFHIVSTWEYAIYALLGLAAGVVGIGFVRTLYGLEDIVDRFWRRAEWLRPAVGGLALGVLLLGLPELYGVGYPVVQSAVDGGYVLPLLVGLLAGKMLATGLTMAIGGSGGVFAPSLFIGAMLGTAFGVVAHAVTGMAMAPAGAYGIVGMGAVFAAAARAPLTAVVIIFELTDDYTIILPLMTAVVLAAGLSNMLSRDTIYTLKLRRRGIDIAAGRSASLMELISVGDAMEPVPQPLTAGMQLDELTGRLVTEHRDALPVVDEAGVFCGVLTARQVEEAMATNAIGVTAADLLTDVPHIEASQSLQSALGTLVRHSKGGVPVLAQGQLVGWLTHRDVLRAYQTRLDRSVKSATADHHLTVSPWTAPVAATLGNFRIVELHIGDSTPAGQCVADVMWPESSLLLAVRRGATMIVPHGNTMLDAGDRLTILVPAAAAASVVDCITAQPSGGRAS